MYIPMIVHGCLFIDIVQLNFQHAILHMFKESQASDVLSTAVGCIFFIFRAIGTEIITKQAYS